MADEEDEYISVGEPIPRMKSVAAGPRRTIHVVWENGIESSIDLSPHISRHRAFSQLADDAAFATVRMDDWGWGIYWPGEPDAAIPTTTLQDLERGTYP